MKMDEVQVPKGKAVVVTVTSHSSVYPSRCGRARDPGAVLWRELRPGDARGDGNADAGIMQAAAKTMSGMRCEVGQQQRRKPKQWPVGQCTV